MSVVPPNQALPRTAAPAAVDPLAGYDHWLLGAALALLGVGVVMVASASVSVAAKSSGDPLHFFWRQVAYLTVGMGLAWLAMRVPLISWHRSGPLLLAAAAILLVLVLVPGIGREVNGSRRWIALAGLNVQPSELAKLFYIVYLAGYLVRREAQVRHVLSGFVKPIALMALLGALLLGEPDFGAMAVMFATTLGMLFLAGVPLRSFALWVILIIVLLAVSALLEPYRAARVFTFLNPWADPYGKGFQLTQALIAVGRGEWFGVGLGAGVQKLFYLPEAHTDFLFAVLAEELGLGGALGVIGLFGCVVWRGLIAARQASLAAQPFGAYLAYGGALLIGLQAVVNIGVNLGLLPTKGLTLPLMSYGGSSLVVSCVAVGLLLRVGFEARRRVT